MNSSNFGSIVSPYGQIPLETLRAKRELMLKYKVGGKVSTVMREFKRKSLHSGSKRGPLVRSRKQAIAIALSEDRSPLQRYAGYR